MAISATSPNVDNLALGQGIIYWMADDDTAWRHIGAVPEVEVTLTTELLEHFSRQASSRVKDKVVVRTKSGSIRFVMEEITPENLKLMLMGTPSSAVVNITTTGDLVLNSGGYDTIDNIDDVTGLVQGRRYNVTGAGIPANTTFTFDGGNGGTLDADVTPGTSVAIVITGAIAGQIFGLTEITGKMRYVGTNDIGPKVTMDFSNVSVRPSGSIQPLQDDWMQMECTGELLADSLDQFGHYYWNTTLAGV